MRSLLSMNDLSVTEIMKIIQRAIEIKNGNYTLYDFHNFCY